MDVVKEKRKKTLIAKAWGRCKSLGTGLKNINSSNNIIKSSLRRSFTVGLSPPPPADGDQRRRRRSHVAPEGCFSVYVGPEKQRFVVRAEFANHPLFRMLLEDAELEYGFNSEGPIVLPCDVVLFCKVLAEMENGGDDEDVLSGGSGHGCMSSGFALRILSPNNNGFSGHSYGSYKLLSPSRLLKISPL
ncbi:auxin-responsive protein SAUR76-like [Humulus lupulus]|uniref:auxin-responsive protein SAUR76-like n=1 Tax=Humulus lupulus TaxID=3486 RepID=UPI002B40572B|nr:auxin-responsive protein SAUR76-like [Humulus lupulus]